MTTRIIIFDDDDGAADLWKKDIESYHPNGSDYETVTMVSEDFRNAVKGLEMRRRAARFGKPFDGDLVVNSFDEATILIVDYDLLKLYEEEYLTGEEVAYLARCYSRCGLIVALNQYGSNHFDLTLKGHPRSYADINIGGDQVRNPGLWQESFMGFRPWSWPILTTAAESLGRRAASLADHLDDPILTYLGFPEDLPSILPRQIVEYLDVGGKEGKDIEDITFRDFVVKSGNGLRGKDAVVESSDPVTQPISDDFMARVAAARIAKWLERSVLPGQDVLVDAPHLVARYPSLLGEGEKDVQHWNRTASLASPAVSDIVDSHRFQVSNWLSRPAWWWNKVRDDERVPEVSNPWSLSVPDCVFCEDVSRFLPKAEAREFVADLSSSFTLRYVVDPETCTEAPLVEEVKKIDYRPKVRFAL